MKNSQPLKVPSGVSIYEVRNLPGWIDAFRYEDRIEIGEVGKLNGVKYIEKNGLVYPKTYENPASK